MEQEAKTAPATAAAIGISFQVGVDDGRQLVFQTHVAQDATREDMDKLVDKLRQVAERQEAIIQTEKLNDLLAKEEDGHRVANAAIENYEADLQANWAAAKKHGAFKLSTQELAQKNNLKANLTRFEVQTSRIRKNIEAYAKKIDGSAYAPEAKQE